LERDKTCRGYCAPTALTNEEAARHWCCMQAFHAGRARKTHTAALRAMRGT